MLVETRAPVDRHSATSNNPSTKESANNLQTFYQMKLLPILLACHLPIAAIAVDKKDEDKKPEDKKDKKEEKQEETKITSHTGTFAGKSIEYTATAGTLELKKDEKDTSANIFYVAYTADRGEDADPSERPIVFCFNGGPGSSSVWLHLGGLGPKRVQMSEDGNGMRPRPPYTLGENPDSMFAAADLVFIDPVSTGYSRAAEKGEARDFHGYTGDIKSIGDFIRLYTSTNGRWLSPKYIAGESYGSFRAAGLAESLQSRFGMYLNGVILVSGVLDFQTLRGNDLTNTCFLPAFAEVAAYHQKLAPDLQDDPAKRRAEAEAFAAGPYQSALFKGARISDEEAKEIAAQLSRFTSLSEEFILAHDLRVMPRHFQEQLLKSDGLVVGRFDARVTGRDGDLAGIYPGIDPSYGTVFGAYSSVMKDYVRRTLKFESDRPYEILTGKVHPWNYNNFGGRYPNVTSELAEAIIDNPDLRVFVACGHQDLATPARAIEHSIDHLDLPKELQGNVVFKYYEGGHMMYTIDESNSQLNKDIAVFVEVE